MDPLKSRLTRDHGLHHLIQGCLGTQTCLDLPVRKQRFDFGGIKNTITYLGIKQGTYPPPISNDHHSILGPIEQ